MTQKEIRVHVTGMNQRGVSIAMNHGEMKDEMFERLVGAMGGTPAEVSIVTGLAEGAARARSGRLSAQAEGSIEQRLWSCTGLTREILTRAALRSRGSDTK